MHAAAAPTSACAAERQHPHGSRRKPARAGLNPNSAMSLNCLVLYGVLALTFSSWVISDQSRHQGKRIWREARRQAGLQSLVVTGCFQELSVRR